MGAKDFQIRHCQNPSCGLRFPWHEGQEAQGRCPRCLGTTEIVVQARLPGEAPESTSFRHDGRFAVLLDNIRSAWNVGSILRSAEGFGFSHAYLCGITPGAENPRVRKTSLGAENSLALSAHRDATVLVQQLKAKGLYILALETRGNGIPLQGHISELPKTEQVVLVVGNEVTGVDPGVLKLADRITYLPMYGNKSSFNVAVAFGAAAYSLISQT